MVDDLMVKIVSILEENEVNPIKESTVLLFDDGFVTLEYNEEKREFCFNIQLDARRIDVSASLGDIVMRNQEGECES